MALFERTGELDALSSVVDGARAGSGRLVLLEGPPGIGKTELVAAARSMAGKHGVDVLSARGDELERDFAYGVVRQLFERRIAALEPSARKALFSGAAGLATSLLGGEPEPAAPGPPDGDPFPLRHGLFWLTVGLSADTPLLLLVDDAHWSDRASLEWIHYLAGRLDGLPVAIVLATRSTEPDAPVPSIEAIRGGSTVVPMRPLPLGADGTLALLRSEFEEEPDPEFTSACIDATGGNPYLLTELARSLAADGIHPLASASAEIEGATPETVRSRTVARLGRLGPEAERLAVAVAILGDGAELRDAGSLADLGEREAADAADTLAAAGFLVSGRALCFQHPLIRAAVDAGLADGDRASHHKRAARVLSDRSTSPERIAAHLLLCEPAGDAWVVAPLLDAAGAAVSRGEPAVAVRYLERALVEDAPDERRGVLLALGSARAQAFDAAGVENLAEALQLTETSTERIAVARLLALSLVRAGRVPEAIGVLTDELERTDTPSGMRLELESDLAAALHFGVDLGVDAAVTALDELLARIPGDLGARSPAERSLHANRAYSSVLAGRPADEAEADAVIALEAGLLDDQGPAAPAWAGAVHALTIVDSPVTSAWLERGVERSTATGSRFGLALNFNILSIHSAQLGSIAAAEAYGWEGVTGARDLGIALGLPAALGALLYALVERGKFDVAWDELTKDGFAESVPEFSTGAILAEGRGRLRIATRDIEGGLADFLEAGERFSGRGVVGPGMSSWRSLAAEAHVLLGSRSEAKALAEQDLEAARRFGRPRPIGIALRALGLSLEGSEAIDLLREAVAVLEPSTARLEHARALCDLGAAMRRRKQRRESREPLARAADIAARCGAAALAERATEELRATGARPRRQALSGAESLTPSELRVARLAAEGMSNREIAQALFVTPKTVEKHLGSAYAKLDIDSRDRLPDALSSDSQG